MNGDWRNELQKLGEKLKNSEENKITNLGYAFQTQDYYMQIEKTMVEEDVKRIINFTLDDKTKKMIENRQKELQKLAKGKNSKLNIGCFQAYVNYPGLVVGMSNPIMCGIEVDEKEKIKKISAFDTGFNFDYVTGLPYIPGSTIKGMLRASILKYQNDVSEWLKENSDNTEISTDELVSQIFGDENNNEVENVNTKMKGNYTNVSDRDIFLDAIIIACEENILKSDYITLHPSMFENPKPIHILALKPDVQLQFHFMLSPRKIAGIDSEKRFELYKSLILDLGIGAKTNTGYGNLTEV